jgi:hypothetical protein
MKTRASIRIESRVEMTSSKVSLEKKTLRARINLREIVNKKLRTSSRRRIIMLSYYHQMRMWKLLHPLW